PAPPPRPVSISKPVAETDQLAIRCSSSARTSPDAHARRVDIASSASGQAKATHLSSCLAGAMDAFAVPRRG
ncbi:MAG: hypothetical protein ACYCST_19315, partial [Acidimicrobiales bacterium]